MNEILFLSSERSFEKKKSQQFLIFLLTHIPPPKSCPVTELYKREMDVINNKIKNLSSYEVL